MFAGLPVLNKITQNLVNMGQTDRWIRLIVGASLAYFGLIAQSLSDHGMINIVAGVFGVTNVIASLVRVCPGYLLVNFSTLRGKADATAAPLSLSTDKADKADKADKQYPAGTLAQADEELAGRNVSIKLMLSILGLSLIHI